MKVYKPVADDKRRTRNRPVGEAWDFEGRTFRYSHRSKAFSIDAGNGGRPVSKWTPADHNSFARFEKLAEDARKKHRRCKVCKVNPSWPESTMCNKCRNAAGGVHVDTCTVEGCDNPRRRSGGWVSSFCTLHLNEHRVKTRELRKEHSAMPDEERDHKPMYSSAPKSKSALPYNWRNCRPGSMSEALRIDAGGER